MGASSLGGYWQSAFLFHVAVFLSLFIVMLYRNTEAENEDRAPSVLCETRLTSTETRGHQHSKLSAPVATNHRCPPPLNVRRLDLRAPPCSLVTVRGRSRGCLSRLSPCSKSGDGRRSDIAPSERENPPVFVMGPSGQRRNTDQIPDSTRRTCCARLPSIGLIRLIAALPGAPR